MKILILGGQKTKNVADALHKRYAQIEMKCMSGIDGMKEMVDSGETFDRVLLFEQAITEDGKYMDNKDVRKRSQTVIQMMKNGFGVFELVCAAESYAILQAFLEETYDIQHRSCTIEISPPYQLNMMAAFVGKSISTLKDEYPLQLDSSSIYKDDSGIRWSDELPSGDSWNIDASGRYVFASEASFDDWNGTENGSNNVKFNADTGSFEEVDSGNFDEVTDENIDSEYESKLKNAGFCDSSEQHDNQQESINNRRNRSGRSVRRNENNKQYIARSLNRTEIKDESDNNRYENSENSDGTNEYSDNHVEISSMWGDCDGEKLKKRERHSSRKRDADSYKEGSEESEESVYGTSDESNSNSENKDSSRYGRRERRNATVRSGGGRTSRRNGDNRNKSDDITSNNEEDVFGSFVIENKNEEFNGDSDDNCSTDEEKMNEQYTTKRSRRRGRTFGNEGDRRTIRTNDTVSDKDNTDTHISDDGFTGSSNEFDSGFESFDSGFGDSEDSSDEWGFDSDASSKSNRSLHDNIEKQKKDSRKKNKGGKNNEANQNKNNSSTDRKGKYIRKTAPDSDSFGAKLKFIFGNRRVRVED